MPRKPKLQNPAEKVKEIKARALKHLDRNYDTMVEYLTGVVTGKEIEEVYDPKGGGIVTKEVGHQTRVQAVKVWKEIVVDKLAPDVKEDKSSVKEKSSLGDSIRRLNAKKKAQMEEKAAKAGKLLPMSKSEGGQA